MNFALQNLLYLIGGFIIIFLLHMYMYKRNKKKLNKNDGIGTDFIIRRFSLDLKKITYKKVALIVSLINSIIISFTSMIVININNFIYKILVGFVLISALIFSLYEIVGRYLYKSQFKVKKDKKKKVKKNVRSYKSRK